MTTAHRATWRTARGGDNEEGSFRLHVGSAQQSSKAAPGHRVLKEREGGAPTSDRAALRAALEAREAGEEDVFPGANAETVKALDENVDPDDADGSAPRKRARLLDGPASDGPPPDDAEDESEDDDESDDDDAELLAELERIRAERAAERERREAEEREELERAEDARVASANPLLAGVSDDGDDTASVATNRASFAVKRRWNDDVVFKDKARGERQPEQRFVNDTIRNDFHRRFLKRYMR